jgi:glycosyltransferase involved in cell wall biosynthesis
LRGWTREVYSIFADNLENHRACLRRRRKIRDPAIKEESATTQSPATLRAFVLLTDGFGGFGGIAKFNRDFLAALCAHRRVESVTALPRLMPNAQEPLPSKLVYLASGLGGKQRYLKAVIRAAREFHETDRRGAKNLILCAHLHLLPLALLARRICGGDLHLIVHGVEAWQPSRNRLANACVRRIDGFISVSNLTKRRFMRWSRLRDDQAIVLPNCVDLSAFAPGPKSSALLDRYQLGGKRIILTLGRLAAEERYKGFDEVLEVLPQLARQIPDIAYLICGDGPDRQRLARKATELGVQTRVVFAGKISEAEKADHYRLADAYVMPSSGEGFGIVYLEALACGLPVIGSRADGSSEALLDGRLGTLVDPRDPGEIVSAVLQILRPGRTGNGSLDQNGLSVDYFSTGRFQKRVHDIVDCIAG